MSTPKRMKKKLSRKELEVQLMKSHENEISLTEQLAEAKATLLSLSEQVQEYKQESIQRSARVVQLETEISKLKADEKPQYDVSTKSKARFNWICFVFSISAILTSPYMTWLKKDNTAILSLVFLHVMTEIPEYIRYFSLCKNKKLSWNITKGISLAMDIVSLFLCMFVTGGEPITLPMAVFWGITVSKKYLPNFIELICISADAF